MSKEFYNLTISVTKALNPSETPLKMKHVRNVIIATHQLKEAKSLWVILTRQPLMEHRFSAWKFCHILHKIMREGHQMALKQSLTHKTLIMEVGKLWGHLRDGVGNCIESYARLLVQKVDFHDKNTIFPGSFIIDFRIIEQYAGDDNNIYFQLCVEVLDYFDCILELQERIFAPISTFRMSSMTPQGQCRLAPLITLIQESNPLYDICVRIMFKLHNNLSFDVLTGHRERFHDIFVKLKFFYDNVRPLQYFADVVQLPMLPEFAPNFLSPVEFSNYMTQSIFIKRENKRIPSNENAGDNISLSTSIEQNFSEKNELIKTLQDELNQKEIQLQNETYLMNKIEDLSIKNQSLEKQISNTNDKLREIVKSKDILETQLRILSTSQNEAKHCEDKAKLFEEKFKKIIIMYVKLRDEHISLLRLHGENKRCLQSEKEINESLKYDVTCLHLKLKQLEEKLQAKNIEDEQLHKSQEFNNFADKFLKSETVLKKINEKQEYKKKVEDAEKIVTLKTKDRNCTESIEHVIKYKSVLIAQETPLESIYNDKHELHNYLKVLKCNLTEMGRQCIHMTTAEEITNDAKDQVLHINSTSKSMYNNMNNWVTKSLNDIKHTPKQLLMNVDTLLEFFSQLDAQYIMSCNQSQFQLNESSILTYIQITTTLISFHYHIIYLCDISADLLQIQELLNVYEDFRLSILRLFKLLRDATEHDDIHSLHNLNLITKLQKIHELLTLLNNITFHEQNVGDLLEQELKIMDKMIEDATNRINEIYSASKSAVSSIKLKVNGEILDSCTTLMQTIKFLIQKSRCLQEEIVLQSKGNFPCKEFYKRNSQWTEGLISAAKNIAKGANYFVEAVNKFFESEMSNNFEIVAAAQEISASTAQLVIASKVKVHKDSPQLMDLMKALRDVSQAIACVLVIVESHSMKLSDMDDIDITNLTTSQVKAREMEIQVKVLELEKALQNERYKLTSFRRACYNNSQND